MVKHGDPILPHMTANWYNAVTNATNRRLGGRAPIIEDQFLTVMVQNHSETAKNIWDAVAIGTPAFNYDVANNIQHHQLVFNTSPLDVASPNNWAVLLAPLPGKVEGEAPALAPAMLSGITWVNLDEDPTEDFITADDLVLKTSTSGKGHVIFRSSYEASEYVTAYRPLIAIGIPSGTTSDCILAKTPSGGIPACTGTGPYTFGSAICTIVGDDGVVGTATETIKNIVNKVIAGNVIIKAEKVGSIYVVDVASCPAA